MERLMRRNFILFIILLVCIVVFFLFKLYDLQVIKTGGKVDNRTTYTTYTRVKAARGDILDRNGNVLVSNRASYDLIINHFVLISADGTNQYLYDLYQCCKNGGYEYIDHFPITKERPFTYTLEEYNSSWQKYFQQYLVEMAKIDSDITAPILLDKLRDKYSIPDSWTDEEARAVVGLRYELDLRRCVDSLSNYAFMEDASDEALSAVVELSIPGLTAEASTVREYSSKYAAHILGYVGPMSAEQWETYKKIDGYSMDAAVGQSGLEAAYEEYLHGTDGLREDTVAKDGTLISSRFITTPKAGSNVEVSIDLNLQMAAEENLASVFAAMRAGDVRDGKEVEGGAVVAMDVKTGQMLVCASYPTYNLATFSEDYENILQADFQPLYNRALQAAYAPGSTYKVSMTIAAISAGIINSETAIYDKGVFTKYEGFSPACLQYSSHHTTHGSINVMQALQVSCNYFFYELGDRIGLSTMDNTAKALGLGESTGIELPEATGYRANKETKKKLYKGDDAKWFQGDQILAAIGQSENRFTPIQLCSYAATLANRGTRYKATFMSRVVSADYRQLLAENNPQVLSTMTISDDAYKAYTTGMYMVANELGGTAYSTFKNYPVTVAAKTGTAQYGTNMNSDHAAFICYAPFDDPQIAIAIYGEKAGHGSSLAAIARSILDVYFGVDEVGDVVTNENKLS